MRDLLWMNFAAADREVKNPLLCRSGYFRTVSMFPCLSKVNISFGVPSGQDVAVLR